MNTTAKITVSLVLDDATPTPNDISNAVRRALTQATLKDVPLTPDNELHTKGVTVRIRPIQGKVHQVNPVREFAHTHFPEFKGKRGRFPKQILEAYEAFNAGQGK